MSNNNNTNKAKPDAKCQTKIQLTFTNVVPAEEYTCNLGSQSMVKTAEEEEETLTFMFQFKKPTKVIKGLDKAKPDVETVPCPAVGETLIGDINGTPISVSVMSTKKPTKVTIDLPSEVEGAEV